MPNKSIWQRHSYQYSKKTLEDHLKFNKIPEKEAIKQTKNKNPADQKEKKKQQQVKRKGKAQKSK